MALLYPRGRLLRYGGHNSTHLLDDLWVFHFARNKAMVGTQTAWPKVHATSTPPHPVLFTHRHHHFGLLSLRSGLALSPMG